MRLTPSVDMELLENKRQLTITAHSDSDALLESTVLASVAIDAENGALLILGARPILDLLLNTPPEETLENFDKNEK